LNRVYSRTSKSLVDDVRHMWVTVVTHMPAGGGAPEFEPLDLGIESSPLLFGVSTVISKRNLEFWLVEGRCGAGVLDSLPVRAGGGWWS
jgi:hypothetical protein